mmetsp:Transcript_10604/g.16124  ORF Transcript_10604/g.16124 Transcript_10604/m.16124 type:complete len:126 (+) Transcript_10604:110-487(+)|eukprot:CAMPEP_0201719498 /NCGR_PEP_ID=MMETSP0593-20130828/4685_1 /ASSEMBLY_ACC=CAM_ASM_000672 /TAXON_ID=267983 /ORGANISM="Skeletonema japonicum, Strain CCMP2506" /LENGTH=125 /DNA_ID=CAMNT_0048209945 /DNA_START=46 /DNA_END=423 /DNA_ORIENTATION=-
MTAATTPPIHVLRGILRHIKKTAPTTAAATSSSQSSSNSGNELSLSKHVISQYRQSISATPQQAQHLRKVAYDYLNLKKDLTERARLHELDSGADVKLSPRELSRRAAARAGLQLPVMDDGHVDQ